MATTTCEYSARRRMLSTQLKTCAFAAIVPKATKMTGRLSSTALPASGMRALRNSLANGTENASMLSVCAGPGTPGSGVRAPAFAYCASGMSRPNTGAFPTSIASSSSGAPRATSIMSNVSASGPARAGGSLCLRVPSALQHHVAGSTSSMALLKDSGMERSEPGLAKAEPASKIRSTRTPRAPSSERSSCLPVAPMGIVTPPEQWRMHSDSGVEACECEHSLKQARCRGYAAAHSFASTALTVSCPSRMAGERCDERKKAGGRAR
mmetsp:Transcript_9069/g.28068  ORF Transcript_9069/g.28068 Transcript_9069/m.28068 type:complete len:266 (+) Transcript_9069:2352-3149(+)